MPQTDYDDPELIFPRLQVRIFTIDGKTQLIDAWLWPKAGGERQRITIAQRAGSMDDAHRLIAEFCVKHKAVCDPGDIEVED